VVLAAGKIWNVKWVKGKGIIRLEIIGSAQVERDTELKQFKVEVPLAKWSLVVKHVQSDRKLLGGILLDFAKHKERVSAAVGSDRRYLELQRVILDATVALVEAGLLALTPTKSVSD
jgi:hypothetical protein